MYEVGVSEKEINIVFTMSPAEPNTACCTLNSLWQAFWYGIQIIIYKFTKHSEVDNTKIITATIM